MERLGDEKAVEKWKRQLNEPLPGEELYETEEVVREELEMLKKLG